jgi:hypothetical protein
MSLINRTRAVLAAGPALAIGLAFCAAVPAQAAAPSAAARATATGGAGTGALAATPRPGSLAAKAGPNAPGDSAIVFAGLFGDSCVPSQNSTPYECEAVGYWDDGDDYPGLALFSTGGAWTSGDNMGTPPEPNAVTQPGEVSCAEVTAELPDCLAVGIHYNFNGSDVQFAAWGGANFFQVVQGRNPRGTTWSSMDDVSCPTSTFCMVVGAAGRKNTSFATAYTWNGRSLRALSVPGPRYGHDAELGGLSCVSSTFCVAVGNYENRAGRSLAYAAIWTGRWRVESAPTVRGQTATIYNAVSCPSTTSCVAVGYSYLRRLATEHTFAATWNGRAWRIAGTPRRAASGLASVSCPVAGTCFASGWTGPFGLAERWNGRTWSVERTVRPAGSENDYELLHVSCVSTVACAAVGLRFNRHGERTLAERWNGKTWTLQSSVNN